MWSGSLLDAPAVIRHLLWICYYFKERVGGRPRVVVSTAAFHARVWGSVSGLGGLKETKMFLPHPRVKVSIMGSLSDREVACSASDRQGSNFESCVWRAVSSHHPQKVLLAQCSLYVHKGGLKPDSYHFKEMVLPLLDMLWSLKSLWRGVIFHANVIVVKSCGNRLTFYRPAGASFCIVLKQKVLILYLNMLQKLAPAADFYNILK